MACLISSPSASSKPVTLLHCCELQSVTECTWSDMYEPVISRDLITFPLSQTWAVLPANPGLGSTSQKTQRYKPASSPPAGSAPQLTGLCISNLSLFSLTEQKLLQTCYWHTSTLFGEWHSASPKCSWLPSSSFTRTFSVCLPNSFS